MKTFDVQSIEMNVPRETAFAYIADAAELPRWTNAFASVKGGTAVLRTPDGEVDIDLVVRASLDHGTVDWRMTFPDRSVATAFSRVIATSSDRCIFSFVLTPPPVPLEKLEDALEAQSRILTEELQTLKGILESHA